MKEFITCLVIFFSIPTITAAEEENKPADKPGPLMIGLYGTLGFTLSGEKNINTGQAWDKKVYPTFGFGYSAGASLGFRAVDDPINGLSGIAPVIGCEFSAKNHKYSNYNFFSDKKTLQWRTYFMDLLAGLRFYIDPVYIEPGVYLGFPVLDWKYKRVDEINNDNLETTVNDKRRQKDIGIYLQIGSLIQIDGPIYADVGAHMRFGITRTIDTKNSASDIESANRFYMSFHAGIMTLIDI